MTAAALAALLIASGWTTAAAAHRSAATPVVLSAHPAAFRGATHCSGNTAWVEVAALYDTATVAHEMVHAEDCERGVLWPTGLQIADFLRLAQEVPEARAAVEHEPGNPVEWRVKTIERLGWRLDRLPAWYADEYLPYTRHHRILLTIAPQRGLPEPSNQTQPHGWPW